LAATEVEASGKAPKLSRKERKAEAAAVAAATPFATAPGLGPDGVPLAVNPLSPLPPDGADKAKKPIDRRTLMLLAVLLVVVIGGGAYLITKKSNSSTTAPPVTTPATADKALAVSVNLRQTDLPTGWTVVAGAASPAASTTTPAAKAADVQAVSAFAGCLGMPDATIGQLFGDVPQADETATAASPVYQSPTDPNIQMQSTTNVVKSIADATADSVPFTKPTFAPCFQVFEASTAAATVPGTTAQVTPVTLTAPGGVVAYGYVTTFTIPNQGTKVEGNAFIFGGRIEATLTPTTNGVPVPSGAFSQAYDAMVGRVAADKDK